MRRHSLIGKTGVYRTPPVQHVAMWSYLRQLPSRQNANQSGLVNPGLSKGRTQGAVAAKSGGATFKKASNSSTLLQQRQQKAQQQNSSFVQPQPSAQNLVGPAQSSTSATMLALASQDQNAPIISGRYTKPREVQVAESTAATRQAANPSTKYPLASASAQTQGGSAAATHFPSRLGGAEGGTISRQIAAVRTTAEVQPATKVPQELTSAVAAERSSRASALSLSQIKTNMSESSKYPALKRRRMD